MAKKWYVIHTYSGYENKVETRSRSASAVHLEDKFGEILIPTETVTETRRRQDPRAPEDQLPRLHLRRDGDERERLAPRQGHAQGHRLHRQPAPQEVPTPHIDNLRKRHRRGRRQAEAPHQFEDGDEVRVLDGAFANFTGTVEEVKPDKQKLKVKVSIFGRPTSVELDFSAVEKR